MQSTRSKEKSHSLISELFMTANEARIWVNYDESKDVMDIWSKKDMKKFEYRKRETSKTIGSIFERRHSGNLLKQKCRRQSFCTLRNSKVSNFFIGNTQALNPDNLIRFVLRARNREGELMIS
jgi:hypothetical protein